MSIEKALQDGKNEIKYELEDISYKQTQSSNKAVDNTASAFSTTILSSSFGASNSSVLTSSIENATSRTTVGASNNTTSVVNVIDTIRSECFLWSEDSKIVVIDVEGAITVNKKGNSSVWASLFGSNTAGPAVHAGVTQLLNSIYENGYKILYIAQHAISTKEQLEKISFYSSSAAVTGANSSVSSSSASNLSINLAHTSSSSSGIIKLPPGPIIHSPECLMGNSVSYVSGSMINRSDLFKAAVLRGLKSLFPSQTNPYYACFGTKPSDMIAFSRIANVPEGLLSALIL